MWKSKKKARELEVKVESLKEEKERLEEELRAIKHKHKLEEEDTKHLVKIRQEQLDIQHDRKVIELERQQQEAIAQVKDEYRDKMEKALEKQITDIKEMYGQILERLPNVNYRMKQEL